MFDLQPLNGHVSRLSGGLNGHVSRLSGGLNGHVSLGPGKIFALLVMIFFVNLSSQECVTPKITQESFNGMEVRACRLLTNPNKIEDRINHRSCSWITMFDFHTFNNIDVRIKYHPRTIIKKGKELFTFENISKQIKHDEYIYDDYMLFREIIADCYNINEETYILSADISNSNYIEMLERPYKTYENRISGHVGINTKISLCVKFEPTFFVDLDKMPFSFNVNVPVYVCKTSTEYNCECKYIQCILKLSEVNDLKEVCSFNLGPIRYAKTSITNYIDRKYALPRLNSDNFQVSYDGLVYIFTPTNVKSSFANESQFIDYIRDSEMLMFRPLSNTEYAKVRPVKSQSQDAKYQESVDKGSQEDYLLIQVLNYEYIIVSILFLLVNTIFILISIWTASSSIVAFTTLIEYYNSLPS